jgi:hypothetical protein
MSEAALMLQDLADAGYVESHTEKGDRLFKPTDDGQLLAAGTQPVGQDIDESEGDGHDGT